MFFFVPPPQLLADCLAIAIATQWREEFTPDIQAAFHKFLSVVVYSLGSEYH